MDDLFPYCYTIGYCYMYGPNVYMLKYWCRDMLHSIWVRYMCYPLLSARISFVCACVSV